MRKRELVALLLLCRCYRSLTFPGRVVGLYYVNVAFALFPTFISWSYSLTFLNNRVYGLFLDGPLLILVETSKWLVGILLSYVWCCEWYFSDIVYIDTLFYNAVESASSATGVLSK